MELLTTNLTDKVRREVLNGREHLVAPLSMIVPGVLPGSKGPLYYSDSEIAKEPEIWNNVPITVGHPKDDSGYISARSPEVLNRVGIGNVFNTVYNGKLVAEGWFDVEKTRAVDERILNSLEANLPIELSTGLFTDRADAPKGSKFNGKAYKQIATNFRPDHLAILPDHTGACSIKDGCGVMVNQDGSEEYVLNSTQPRVPAGSPHGGEWKSGKGGGGSPGGSAKAPKAPKDTIQSAAQKLSEQGYSLGAGKTDLKAGKTSYEVTGPDGKSSMMSVDEIRKLISKSEPTRNLATMHPLLAFVEKSRAAKKVSLKELGKLVKDFVGNEASHDTVRDSLQKLLYDRFNGGYVGDVFDSYCVFIWSGKAYKIGYTIDKKDQVTISPDMPVEVSMKRVYTPVTANDKSEAQDDGQSGPSDNSDSLTENQDMAKMTEEARKKLVDSLITNCDCGGKTPKGQPSFGEDDRTALNAMTDKSLMTMADCRKAMAKSEPAANLDPDDGDDDEAPPVANRKTQTQIEADWRKTAPKSVLKGMERLEKMEKKHKAQLISRLTANVSEDDVDDIAAVYEGMDTEKLEKLVKALPTTNRGRDEDDLDDDERQSYFGANGAPVTNMDKDEEILLPPTVNWSEDATKKGTNASA